jgi:hypothetical protein
MSERHDMSLSPVPDDGIGGTRPSAGVIACVVDKDPRFHFEALRWYAGLNRIARVDASHLVVHAVGPDSSPQLDYLRRKGVTVRSVEQFDTRHPPCNKISGSLALMGSRTDGLVILTDSDVALLEDPRALAVSPDSIASRIVVHPLPTLEVLTVIFEAANLQLPPLVPLDWPDGAFTVAGNGNGGLYLIPGALLDRIVSAWEKWARWLLARLHLFEPVDRRRGLDQVAMAMAMASEGVGWERLDNRWNLPIPLYWKADPRLLLPPAGLHYHKEVEPSGELKLTQVPSVDGRIQELNSAIQVVFQECQSAQSTR